MSKKEDYKNGFYQLSYFDTKYNKRFKYLNGSSWPSQKEVEDEWEKIKVETKRKEEKVFVFSTRTKWALEVVRNKKRIFIKSLE